MSLVLFVDTSRYIIKVLISRARDGLLRQIDTCAKLIQVSDTSRERISAIATSTYYYKIYERARAKKKKREQIEYMRERFRALCIALYKRLAPTAWLVTESFGSAVRNDET